MNARELYSRLARRLESNLPPGVPPEYVRAFLRRLEPTFTALLSRRLAALCAPDRLVEGFERIIGLNTEPEKKGHLQSFQVGLKARCHPGNPSIRQYAIHWRYAGALKPQKGRWIRVSAKISYDDQPWKLWPGDSWDGAAWNEEEAIRRFVEDHLPMLWWLEGKTPAGPGLEVDPLEDERTQLTDLFAIQYAREWRDLGGQATADPDLVDRLRERREREAARDWWRSRALPDPQPSAHAEPVQLLMPGSLQGGGERLERLPAWGSDDDRCPDCDDRGWYHDGTGQLTRCTYCGRYDSDHAMAEAHFELGCSECGWPAGGLEDRSGSSYQAPDIHPAVGRRARLREDWYDDLAWKHTFPKGLEGTVRDVDARGRAELDFDHPMPMSWRANDDEPGELTGIFVPLALLEVEGGV